MAFCFCVVVRVDVGVELFTTFSMTNLRYEYVIGHISGMNVYVPGLVKMIKKSWILGWLNFGIYE